MTKAKLLDSVLAGAFLRVGEYRSHEGRVSKFTDDETGKVKEISVIEFMTECSGKPLQVTQELAPGTDPAKFVTTLKKGDTVVIYVKSHKWHNGSYRAKGTLEPLTA